MPRKPHRNNRQSKPAANTLLVNAMRQAVTNRAASVHPFFTGNGAHSLDSKRPYLWAEFGYPNNPVFSDYYSAFKRHPLGRAGVMRHIEKTWCSNPCVKEREDEHEETKWEAQLYDFMERLDFWRALEGTDTRNRVGQYAGLILRYADSKRFADPVDRVPGGLDGLVGVIPCYESQLQPSEWEQDEQSPNYGMPKMYQYNEATIGDNNSANPGRAMQVHPDRVVIWAEGADDGSIYGTPALEAGLNNLIDIEKIVGSGGEGFWKNARAPLKLNVDAEADLSQLATMLGTNLDGLADKIDELTADFLSGADKAFISQGIDPQNLSINLPSPEHFLAGSLQCYVASINVPMKILLGSQTGERASTEDAKEFNATIMSRRNRFVIPMIRKIIRRLMDVGVIPRKESFYIEWEDLSAPSDADKLENGKKMADINRLLMGTGEIAFSAEEIRKACGYDDPLSEDDLQDFEDEEPEPIEQEPPVDEAE